MLQTTTRDYHEKSVPPAPEFPAPAEDISAPTRILARQAFSPAFRSAVQQREQTALVILDELDNVTAEIAGRPLVSSVLERLGCDKQQAAAMFANLKENVNEDPADIIHQITDIPEVRIQALFEGARPEDADVFARRLIQEACKSGEVPIRNIIIESVATTTLRNPNDYEARRAEATEQYESVLKEISHANAGDMVSTVGRGLWDGIVRPLKACGLFIFESVVTYNLPSVVRERLGIKPIKDGDEVPASWFASAAIGGVADLYLILAIAERFLGPGWLPTTFGEAAWKCACGLLAGGFVETMGRAILTHDFAIQAGWLPLELALMPFRIFGRGIDAARKGIESRKLDNLRKQGL